MFVDISGRTPQVIGEILGITGWKFKADNFPLENLSKIAYMDLSWKNIGVLSEEDFAGMTGLKSLNLRGNGLGEFPNEVFKGLPGLKYLDLSWNSVSFLFEDLFIDLVNLSCLDLSNNGLLELKKDIFKNLSNLRLLNLYYNELKGFRCSFFRDLKKLEDLDLRLNNLDSSYLKKYKSFMGKTKIRLDKFI